MLLFVTMTISCLLAVSAQTSGPGSTAPWFPKCVTTCKDSSGQNNPDGNYASCEQCAVYISCSNGNVNIMKCAPGTNYYDRVLGFCVIDSSVCVNDSLLTSPATMPTSSTTLPATTVASTTTPQTTPVATTTPTQAPTSQSTTTTTMTTTTTILLTTQLVYSNKTGYVPSPGGEAESFWFAMDMFNNYAHQDMRSGAASVSTSTAEAAVPDAQPGLMETWYRFYGVTLVPSQCPNTAENKMADYNKCPLVGLSSGVPQNLVAKCDFKVHYFPQRPTATRLDMTYMMCYQ